MQHTHTQNILDIKPKKKSVEMKKKVLCYYLIYWLTYGIYGIITIGICEFIKLWGNVQEKVWRKSTHKTIIKWFYVLFQCGKINWLWNWKAWIGRTIKEFKLKYNWRFPGHANYSAQLFYLTIINSGSLIIDGTIEQKFKTNAFKIYLINWISSLGCHNNH